MGVAASWLPPELWVTQPYSMGALVGCPPDQSRPCPIERRGGFISPSSGTIKIMDAPELAILTCLIAPAGVQREARKGGERALMMLRAKGLAENLGMNMPEHMAPPVEVRRELTEWEREQEARRQFAEALAALDDDEE